MEIGIIDISQYGINFDNWIGKITAVSSIQRQEREKYENIIYNISSVPINSSICMSYLSKIVYIPQMKLGRL